jgi:hypothetical protein
VTFEAHVVLAPAACLTRPVPAFVDPCEGAERDSACSRAVEIGQVVLRPGPAPGRPLRYRRMRLLLGLANPMVGGDGSIVAEDRWILAQRDALLATPSAARSAATMALLRALAAYDAMELSPAPGPGEPPILPAPADAPLVLADLHHVTLEGGKGAWRLTRADVDFTPRPTHVATSTIQDLLAGAVLAPDSGGPRVLPSSVALADDRVTLTFDRPVASASVQPEAFAVTSLTTSGWSPIAVSAAGVDDAGTGVTLELQGATAGRPVRVLARGTGPAPILGSDPPVPLAGAVGGPAGTPDDGHDFVHIIR